MKRPWWRRWWTVSIAILAVLMVIGAMTNSDADSAKKPVSAPPPSHAVKAKSTEEPKVRRATVPVLGGMSLAQARQELRDSHLFGGYIERRPSAAQPGTVLSQGLHGGKQVTWNSKVPLVIAAPYPMVPATSGHGAAAAAQALHNAGFRVRTVHRTVTSGTDGVVLSQSPLGGTRLRPHAVVTIVVAHVVRPVVATPTQAPVQPSNCTPGYSPCLPPASDYDCGGGSGNGPKYVYGVERVTGSDPYDLDADGDGYGCE
jgi:beta-lactam-binding protein with PASTA domain